VLLSNGIHPSRKTSFSSVTAKSLMSTKRPRGNVRLQIFFALGANDSINATEANEILTCATTTFNGITTCPDGQVTNMFHNDINNSKQCAQGAIANLLSMLQCSEVDLNLFWKYVNADHEFLEKELHQQVPTKVKKSRDTIEKSLWILRTQFKFVTTKKLKLDRLTSIKPTLKMLQQIKFPVLIAVSSKQSSYDHVVVVWNSMVIDYESMYTYALSEETLRQVCGPNTTFEKVTSGYGLFPPNNLRLQVNSEKDIDWGITEYYKRDGSSIHGYFT